MKIKLTRRGSNLSVFLVTVFVLTSAFGGQPPAGTIMQEGGLKAKALQYIANQQGLPIDQLSIATSSAARFPLSGMALKEFKVVTRDGQMFGVSFDAATRQVVDPADYAAQEQQMRQATYATVEPALYEQLQRNAGTSTLVAIWVAMEGPDRLGRAENLNVDALAGDVQNAQSLVANAARGLGATVAEADLVPVLFAELNAAQINKLAQHPNVMAIELIPQDLERYNDDSGTADRFVFIWGTATGAGTKVAIHEDDGVDNVNPFLNNATHNVIYWNSASPNIGDHATNVAGVIASTDNWRRGGAFQTGQILSANFQSFANAQNMVNSASWAIINGADTINMSWGTICSGGAPNFFSRWADFLVKTFGVNIVVSAGNSRCPAGTPQFVGAPSLGWNTISVGSYWDRDTGSRTDDVLSSFTSFVNPRDPNSGRTYEKPDVAGMGGQVDATGCHGSETTAIGSGHDSTCGTSFAAPDVTALTALVVGKEPTRLRRNSEAVKAIIMAGATHNIADGVNYRACATSPVVGDCRDGAGAIDAFQTIQNVVVPGNWRMFGGITPGSFNASGNIDIPVTLTQGKNVRVVIAWDSTAVCTNLGTATQSCASDVLNADIDLVVLNPSNVLVASAASLQNSAEVVDFTAAVTGTYIVRIHRFRFDAGTNTFLGVAWNKDTVDRLNTPLKGVVNFPLNTTKTNQTTDMRQSFWDTYSGTPAGCVPFLNRENGLEKIYKVTTTSAGRITATLSGIVGFPGVNSDIDVIILKRSGPALDQNNKVVACGDTTAAASGQPAGTYYIVVDGFNGAVAKYNLSVNFTAGADVLSEEPLPVR